MEGVLTGLRVRMGMTSPPTGPTTVDLAAERFVSLTTFRRSGEAVATPVWVLGQGEELLVMTPSGTGKLRRLGHDPRVTVRPCDRRGRVDDGAPVAHGTAVVDEDPHALAWVRSRLRAKYGPEYRLFMMVEAVVRRSRSTPRVVVRISLSD